MVLDLCSNDPKDNRQLFSHLDSRGPIVFARSFLDFLLLFHCMLNLPSAPGSTQGELKCLTVDDISTVGSATCDHSENQLWFMVLAV